MKTNWLRHALVFFLSAGLALSFSALAEDGPDAAKALVAKVAAFYQANGKAATIETLNQADGPFAQGSLYAFAYDLTGTMVAHPKNPKLVGKNLIDVPDAEGKLFRKDIIETAQTKGEGWVDYLYKDPTTSQLEPKTTYLKRLDDIVVCAGTYRK